MRTTRRKWLASALAAGALATTAMLAPTGAQAGVGDDLCVIDGRWDGKHGAYYDSYSANRWIWLWNDRAFRVTWPHAGYDALGNKYYWGHGNQMSDGWMLARNLRQCDYAGGR